MASTITHVVFDLDGVLIDTERHYTTANERTLEKFGAKFTREMKLKMMGRKKTEAVTVLLKEAGISDRVMMDQYIAEYDKHVFQIMRALTEELPGSTKLIDHLYAHNIPMAICTGSDNEEFASKMVKFDEWLKKIPLRVLCGSDPEVRIGKPNPDAYEVTIGRFAAKPTSPKNVLVFEDSINGVESALGAGCTKKGAELLLTYCIRGSTALNYQYNYNNIDDAQHRQLHRIWETSPEGELLILQNTAAIGGGEAKNAASSDHSTVIRPMFLDIYLPNGVLLPIQCPAQRTLALLKQDVFIQARKYPLASQLTDISNYIFSTIGLDGTHVELYDERKPISSLQFLFLPLLILIEPSGNKTEKELNQSIGLVMGISLNELELSMSEELHQYRLQLFETCREAERQRGTCSFGHYAFPEDPLLMVHPVSMNAATVVSHGQFGPIEINETDLDYAQFPEQPGEVEQRAMEKLRRKVQFSDAYLEVWYGTLLHKAPENEPTNAPRSSAEPPATVAEQFKHCVHIRNALEMTSEDVVQVALRELLVQHGVCVAHQSSDFILQIAGRRVFITRRDVFLTQFEYIRSCFENYRIPRLILRLKKHIFSLYPPPPESFEPSYVRKERHSKYMQRDTLKPGDGQQSQPQQQQKRLFWDLDDNLRCVQRPRQCRPTVHSRCVSPSNPRWHESTIEFDVYLKDLPESAQLCFSLISVHCSASPSNANASQNNSKGKGSKNLKGSGASTAPSSTDHLHPIGWTNLRLFDWRKHFDQLLALRSVPPSQQFVNFGHFNGHGDSFTISSRTPRLEIELFEYCGHSVTIEYPPESVIQRYIAWTRQQRKQKNHSEREEEEDRATNECSTTLTGASRQHQQLLVVDTACELLDGRYVDAKLRAMAVHHLDNALNDDQLQLYLLILVQQSANVRKWALRNGPQMSEAQISDRICRAANVRFSAGRKCPGRKSENALSKLFSRYALLLEAYCRGNSVHLHSMIKQVEMVSTLTALSSLVRACGNKEMGTKKLQQELMGRKESMQHIVSPVNATDHLGELIVEECRVLGSAKQPLFLTWRNPELLAHLTMPCHQLIFKCGDDMRQDMLTLHVMRIMDAKWKSQLQQDFCMTLYEVLPMGKNIGLIHVVPDCQTLFQIQCESKRKYTGTSLNMEVDLLNKHIYKKCCANDSKKYLECVDRFTFSLAGYCVATYVLGIKDRHQDNIMLARDGRIFHIDFGHFLGHTKRKLGINRERTEFILTDHFLYVISRGKSNFRQTYEYNSFRDECTRGFLVLHNQARFFIAIFRMMCCMAGMARNSDFRLPISDIFGVGIPISEKILDVGIPTYFRNF
ncbi:hypothetical protein niasHT_006285 [Heterodera trifolii]|uniref:Uncharacterized protein n=1 Tax=Heterodera trifolii TaxID=157864 RepID=A0ABD2LRW2_9BILA